MSENTEPAPAPPASPPAPRRRSRVWALLAVLLLAVLGWRAVYAPARPPVAVGEAVVLRTPGGRLELAELRQTESFEVTRDHTVLGVPVGSTFSRIRVPAHYRYHVDLAPEWRVHVLPDGGVRVLAPPLAPTLPVAIDTARLQQESRGLWSLFTGPAQVDALQRSITEALSRKAGTTALRGQVREAARQTVAEFVTKWLMKQTEWQPHADQPVQVLFADEPIEALGAACQGQPSCMRQWLPAADF